MRYLRQSTSVDVVIGPVWSTTDGALKSDLAYNASGINCDIYKNGTKADISLQGTAGNGYLRPGSGEAQYILTLSTTDTNTIGSARITLSATGFYMRPEEFVVLHANVYDALFGSTALATVGAKMDLVDAPNTTAREAFRTTMQAAGTTLATLLSRIVGTLAIGTHNPQSGDAYARLGAPSGASVSADIAAIPAPPDVSGIEAVTEKLDTMLEADDDDYRFTEAALVNAPAGEGGGGGPSAVQIRQEIDANSTQLIAIKAKTDNLPASPAAVGSAMGLADDAITAAKFDESTAFPLKSADAGATQVARTGADGDTLETISDQLDAVPTAEENADQVWDEAIADHAGVGSTGEQLAAAGAAGDPWSTPLPGAYGAGTAGKIVGDNLDAAISSRSSHNAAAVKTAIEAAGSHLTLIKAVTDAQGGTGSGLSAVPWNGAWDAEVQSECADAITAAGLSTLDAAGVRTAVGMAGADLDAQLAALPTANENADALLGRNIAGGSSVGRTVTQALRALRNKIAIAAGTMTVYEEDDTTPDWTGAVTTDPAADPITEIDPA